ncbi:methyltransferase regulatory domain-containing protein [Bradyrhizobium sp. AUGA SZCCT0182]|uniref:methyltransferase regulatory domain-containing protein n=1 Tax=Bradyrhizobium sp. AUGA SZCCT0182 TaxID=2807667 RepID=UPI001BA9C686|nr:class I SAM-dependent methyltransferase [Bradyrhizobium sp. AUGA SZCCT0182]MBR1232077.1 methyltransferase regulatory domain-containing protein [Bradyrhizobium sp. AUGA SZCCT0182]
MTISASPTLYDDVFYPGRAYEHTHPNRLATLASLYGMSPPPAEHCRVLELGCGVGGNLLPLAFQYPESEFVGIDLSGVTIERGQRNLAGLGLTNIKLLHCDILEVDPSFGQFDYIVAHGVYSWVPASVRHKMMAIFKAHLSHQGVAYVSYNAHPFSHVRNLARDMMLFHTRHLSEMQQKVAQARAIMKFLSEGSKADTVHGAIMREQYTRVAKMMDEVLFHDDLNESAEAFLLHQVVEAAEQHGLQYLSDAEFSRRNLAGYSEEVRAALQRFPDDEFAARDQYQDFIDGFGFRRTLLCHDDVRLRRTLDMNFASRFYLLASTDPVTTEFCLTDHSDMEFKTQEGSSLRVSHPLLKSAYLCLGRAWPSTLTLDQLVEEAGRQLEIAHAGLPSTQDVQLLVEAMFVLACSGEVNFFLSRPNVARIVSDRPLASPVARRQSESETMVTNMLHQTVRLEDQRGCEILQLLDGSRGFDELVDLICRDCARLEHNDDPQQTLQPDREAVSRRLHQFLQTAAKLGLLIR